ncbi:FUSC family protein [Orenia marismortui]|uniref:FUSC family protein n=1 Tax=Orenia marismortui TaxID=46469 RepID=UPI00037D6354|nr:aromatic acid exporter family protein [Orenia marismortui]
MISSNFEKAFKTGIAVFLSIVIGGFFHINSLFYAAIAAVITLQTKVVDTIKAGQNRVFGTIVGAIIGMCFAIIGQGNAVLCGLGIFLTVLSCQKFGYDKSINIACIVFIAIMINLYDDITPFYYSIYRLKDTLVGIITAIIVDYLILPKKEQKFN